MQPITSADQRNSRRVQPGCRLRRWVRTHKRRGEPVPQKKASTAKPLEERKASALSALWRAR